MATYLYRLGAWSFEHRRRVLMIWLLVLLLVGASAAAFSGQTNDSFAVPGTESQQAQDLLEAKYPGAGGAAARVVFAAPRARRSPTRSNRAAVEASLPKAQATPTRSSRRRSRTRPGRSPRTGASGSPT